MKRKKSKGKRKLVEQSVLQKPYTDLSPAVKKKRPTGIVKAPLDDIPVLIDDVSAPSAYPRPIYKKDRKNRKGR